MSGHCWDEHQRIGQGFYITTKIPISTHTVIPHPWIHVSTKFYTMRFFVSASTNPAQDGWVSNGGPSWQQSINQPLLLDCGIFLIIIQAYCLHLPQNPQQSEERWSFCKEKNHLYNVAKFLHMGTILPNYHEVKKQSYTTGSVVPSNGTYSFLFPDYIFPSDKATP